MTYIIENKECTTDNLEDPKIKTIELTDVPKSCVESPTVNTKEGGDDSHDYLISNVGEKGSKLGKALESIATVFPKEGGVECPKETPKTVGGNSKGVM